MNGGQDLGGRMGFGPIKPEVDEPIFHADWEARVLGLTLCCGALGHWTLDESRHARETLPPADYLSFSYYRIWLEALIKLLLRHGELSERELAEGKALQDGRRPERRLSGDVVPAVLARGGPTERELESAAKFSAGDRVRLTRFVTHSHTRLPSYAMGRTGIIAAVRRPHVYPDSNARGEGENPAWLYTVVFDGEELWGTGCELNLQVSIDAFEPYLEPA